jgi:hypothetical protein
MFGIVTAHQLMPGLASPPWWTRSVVWGLETLLSLISGQGFIEKTAPSSVVLLVGIVVLAFVSRRSFLGQLCPSARCRTCLVRSEPVFSGSGAAPRCLMH